MGWVENLMTILVFLFCLQLVKSNTDGNNVYVWRQTQREYPSDGKRLNVNALAEFENFYLVTQCAYKCLRNGVCTAYNYMKKGALCHLLSETHLTHPLDFIDDAESQYYEKNAFVIDEQALGHCGLVPCHNGGVCLDLPASSNVGGGYVCICPDGWTGINCTIEEKGPVWQQWQDWSACSVTCGDGWKTRNRQCVSLDSGAVLSEFDCYGRANEQIACNDQGCPYWGEWQEWGQCSTHTTCGRGVAVRERSCLHHGTPGMDRLCMGPSNETTPCYRPGCSAPVKLIGGDTHGEGVVLVLGEGALWGSVCADGWDMADADVVCKQMGFEGGAVEVVTESSFQANISKPVMSNVICTGSEHGLVTCQHRGWNDNIECDLLAGVKCIVNGDWNTWAAWGDCSVTCADGTRQRVRQCDYPPSLRGGQDCDGIDTQTKACVEPPCPGWSGWSEWEGCDAICGGGTRTRISTHLEGVEDDIVHKESCNTFSCPMNGQWEGWGAWVECNVSCGGGMRSRERTCHNPKYGGDSCETDIEDNYQDEACNDHPCPIDGVWAEWSEWATCSVTCGGGIHHRQRSCDGPKYGGAACDDDNEDEDQEDCNTHNCPIDGVWAEWSEWATCSVTCGGGIHHRQRPCDGPKYGGAACDDDNEDEDQEACNENPCPVDGEYGNWTDWSTCTATCGTGDQYRTRVCDSPAPKYGGAECQDADREDQECNTQPCPVDAYWQEWNEWSMCDVTCGGGSSSRDRTCVSGLYGGATCEGESSETKFCGDTPCPVDGAWSMWTRWFDCSVTCGGGIATRFRTCSGLDHGGKDCDGDGEEERSCNEHECPIDGVWLPWSDWGACDVSCGGGIQTRTRECDGPFYGGTECQGALMEENICGTIDCPIDGVWNTWADWQGCSVSCGFGVKQRYRTCDGPYHEGADCMGATEDVDQCWPKECPVDGVWKEWGDWAECSLTCGFGTQSRTRECDGPYYDGAECPGESSQAQDCNTHNCPIDGVWEDWSDWAECSVTCGGGQQSRTRECDGPYYEGTDCSGEGSQTQDCNTHYCPIDGVWEDWSDWAECSVTCGGGQQSRTRECDGPYYEGTDCSGEGSQTQDCNTHNCPIDGVWLVWSDWTECSVTCGGSIHDRTRQCQGPFYGGAACDGPMDDREDCNTNACPIPGEWMEWLEWDKCTSTCDSGTRTRLRDCDLTVHGDLTIACLGDNSHTEACNTYSCLPKPKTCGQMVERGMINSDFIGLYLEESVKTINVFCDINDGGITEVRHNFMEPTHVNGYEGPGEYTRRIEYMDENNNTISFSDVIAIVDASKTCKQFISWECLNAAISVTRGNPYSLTWWRNRNNDAMYYWGDTDPDQSASTRDLTRRRITHCSCYLENACDDPSEPCNCNKQDNKWHIDEGFLTSVQDLPVKEFDAGDTGKRLDQLKNGDEEERGFFKLGPLLCSGVSDFGDYGNFNFRKKK